MGVQIVADHHLYDLLELTHESGHRATLTFRKAKGLSSSVDVCCFRIGFIIQAIRTAYSRITIGYLEALCCKFVVPDNPSLLPLSDISTQTPS